MRVSRRALAQYAAERLLAGDAAVIEELAALLVAEGRQHDAALLVRDIEGAMAERGTVVATVESARALDAATRRSIEELLGDATQIHLRQVVRPELIGGVKITTPTQVMDATIAKKLDTLRAKKSEEE
ncbi:MAG: F0F1 ATP synthase subunit delta [Candidatus Saccharibacteria bacterium]|nr:F0F1 ATP synthase subunit delta [Candidatus Saccharibacteria bacterium]